MLFNDLNPSLFVNKSLRHYSLEMVTYCCGLGQRAADQFNLDDDQLFGLKDIIDTSKREGGGVSMEEWLAHVGRELLARNAPSGEGTGIRRLMHMAGLHGTLMSDAINMLGKAIELGSLEYLLPSSVSEEVEEEVLSGYKSAEGVALQAAYALVPELPNMVEAQGMLAYVARGTSKQDIMRLLRIETRMAQQLADTGPFSAYRHNAEARTWRQLTDMMPCSLEFLADPSLSSEADCEAIMRLVMFATQVYRDTGDYTTPVSESVVNVDRAAVAASLSNRAEAYAANEGQDSEPSSDRTELFRVMHDVAVRRCKLTRALESIPPRPPVSNFDC